MKINKSLRFIFSSSLLVLLLIFPQALKASVYFSEPSDTLKKVINAMMVSQRRTWEQGVASQALLELGEKDLVVLMAKDAVTAAEGQAFFLIMEAAYRDMNAK